MVGFCRTNNHVGFRECLINMLQAQQDLTKPNLGGTEHSQKHYYSGSSYFQLKENNSQRVVNGKHTDFTIIISQLFSSSIGWCSEQKKKRVYFASWHVWHRFPVTPITPPPHGYSSSCSARQMMTSACSQWAHNDHSQTKGQHMPANSSLKADLFKLSWLNF